MLCDNCGKREANVRYSENINGAKKQMNLCEECSKKLGITNINLNIPIDFSSFFGSFLEDFQTPEFMPLLNDIKQVQCKECGYTFDDIINTGRFGCQNCYITFEDRIDPILKRIQGSNRHVGRIGKIENKKIEKTSETKKELTEIEKLKEKLKEVIKEENYEEAAKIRDEIKKLEKND